MTRQELLAMRKAKADMQKAKAIIDRFKACGWLLELFYDPEVGLRYYWNGDEPAKGLLETEVAA